MSYISDYNEKINNFIDDEVKMLLQTSDGTKHIKYNDFYNYHILPIFDIELDNLITNIENVKEKKVYNNSFIINATNNGDSDEAILDSNNEKINCLWDGSVFTNTIEYYPAFTNNKLKKYDIDIVLTTPNNDVSVYKFSMILSNGTILEIKNYTRVGVKCEFNYREIFSTIIERELIEIGHLFESISLQQNIRLMINRSSSPQTLKFILDNDGTLGVYFPMDVQTRCEVTEYV